MATQSIKYHKISPKKIAKPNASPYLTLYQLQMTDFGNFGNYGDGGFNQDSGSGGFTNENGGSQRQNVRSSLTPVTIKQINDATQPVTDGEFKIHNVELNMVSFMGVVRKVDSHTSAVTITIEDGSGSIEVRKWIDDTVSTPAAETEKYEKELNKYVYVGGALKEFNNKKNIQNAVIFPVTDHNELLYHNLSAITNHLKSQGVTGAKADNGLFVSDNNGMELPGSMQDKVLNFLRENSPNMQEGVPLTYITQKLNITDDEGHKYCQELIEAGKIYTGFDDTSYLCI